MVNGWTDGCVEREMAKSKWTDGWLKEESIEGRSENELNAE
jgi:hypothetical protein